MRDRRWITSSRRISKMNIWLCEFRLESHSISIHFLATVRVLEMVSHLRRVINCLAKFNRIHWLRNSLRFFVMSSCQKLLQMVILRSLGCSALCTVDVAISELKICFLALNGSIFLIWVIKEEYFCGWSCEINHSRCLICWFVTAKCKMAWSEIFCLGLNLILDILEWLWCAIIAPVPNLLNISHALEVSLSAEESQLKWVLFVGYGCLIGLLSVLTYSDRRNIIFSFFLCLIILRHVFVTHFIIVLPLDDLLFLA